MSSSHEVGVTVEIHVATQRFADALRRSMVPALQRVGAVARRHLTVRMGPDPRVVKRARKARSRALRMSLPAHRR